MNIRYCVGIDLGSTTTKAVVVDEQGQVLGRGITNSRSSYDAACQVAVTWGITDDPQVQRSLEEVVTAIFP